MSQSTTSKDGRLHTSLDPPESTLQQSVHSPVRDCSNHPLLRGSGGFTLIAEVNRPPKPPPDRDPLDPEKELWPVAARSVNHFNASAGTQFRHSTWSGNRQRITDAFEAMDIRPQRAFAFATCGERPIVLRHADDPSRFKVACLRCHDRFCLPCSQDRARLIVANMRAQLPEGATRFLTLTLKHNNDPLSDQIDRLYQSFRYLRRTAPWIASVTGGIAFLELKLGRGDHLWHPHLHVLLRGKYLHQKVIAETWYQITGDSYVVDIRLAKTPDHVYTYLTRYVTKGWGPGLYRDQARLTEAIVALRGRKLLSCFGIFRDLKLLLPPTQETWVELGTLHEINALARRGIGWACLAHAALYADEFIPPPEPVPPED